MNSKEEASKSGPKAVGTPLKEMDLTGMLFPWVNGQVLFMTIEGDTNGLYIPIFTTLETLENSLGTPEVGGYESIKQIENGKEFLASIPLVSPFQEVLHVIVDLRRDPDGFTRFTEIFRKGFEA